MDELAQKMSPILTEHANNILLNEKLFARIKAVYENHRELTPEEQMLLDKSYDGFIRNGANLPAEDKEKFRALSKELSQLTLQFSQNNLKETNKFQLHLTDEKDLAGLPESAVEAAALAAKEKDLEGWVFTLHAPHGIPSARTTTNTTTLKSSSVSSTCDANGHNCWATPPTPTSY